MKARILLTVMAVLVAFQAPPVLAAGKAKKPPQQDWTFSGPFGTYDKAALQRGYKVYKEVCAACHAMKRVHFRNLEALGYSEDQIKNIAAEYTVIDGPDSEGEMFERQARLSDPFPSPYPNRQAAQAANGAYPPDMSLITKARKDGSNYVHALLTGYAEAPEEFIKKNGPISEGNYYNKYMSGNIIKMAPPLMDGQIAYEDGSPETMEQYSKDVAHFLTWAAEPEMEERKRLGIQVLLFLLVFTGVMYGVKKRIWADFKH